MSLCIGLLICLNKNICRESTAHLSVLQYFFAGRAAESHRDINTESIKHINKSVPDQSFAWSRRGCSRTRGFMAASPGTSITSSSSPRTRFSTRLRHTSLLRPWLKRHFRILHRQQTRSMLAAAFRAATWVGIGTTQMVAGTPQARSLAPIPISLSIASVSSNNKMKSGGKIAISWPQDTRISYIKQCTLRMRLNFDISCCNIWN